ncbi:MAG: 23S rRNA (pseudouridine(1915)-N(3))-methyltransferase RlmH [Thermodesulfobacteriota bacterium]
MRLELFSPGKTKLDFIARGIDEYRGRLERFCPIELVVTRDHGARKGGDEERARAEEGRELLGRLPKEALVVALDLSGRMLSSEGLAALIDTWEMEGRRRIAFVIGGFAGLSGEVLARADLRLSLSPMTFTHEMARLLLLEQLYRAFSIKHATGYHR